VIPLNPHQNLLLYILFCPSKAERNCLFFYFCQVIEKEKKKPAHNDAKSQPPFWPTMVMMVRMMINDDDE
jgi:hypothetical protein